MNPLPFPDPPLQAGSVRLRQLTTADVPAVVAACQDPSISRFSPAIPFPYSDADATGWFESHEPMRIAGEALDLAIVHTESGDLLGAIGIHHISIMLRTAELGYWLARGARGHGYMTSAVRLLAGWAFEEVGFARLELTTDPENVESQRVAERCGFRREGYLRSHMLVRHSGERRDSLIYGLLPGDLAESATSRPPDVGRRSRS
jgi:RimJ/RimL family protein N-acetyltransferase